MDWAELSTRVRFGSEAEVKAIHFYVRFGRTLRCPPYVILCTAERRKQRAEGRRGAAAVGGTIDEDDFPEVVGDPDCRGPLEHLGKIVRDLLGVSAGGLVVWQRGSEAVKVP